ncbi:hexokinase-domain-containing protein [Radiomyces spectabilis]|uniref:hexokinase-domain-containing protein n=1 Tax=Radiomyces spectabilis TaxID=64574 RepID=UPI00221EE3B1|nr:hexokinase-domain-containing protein [Radiomyces spectabilis]KAI8388163.1 hexokinase-domain-containing protein [Radiomyces spectabilis]
MPAPPEATTIKDINGSPEQEAYMKCLIEQLTITPDKLSRICEHFKGEMTKGLNKEGHTLAMIPSYVEGRLTGEEKGNFLALDLGGTNLRVVLVTLEGQGKFKTVSTKARISDTLKTGPMRDLCDYIADCIDTFLTEQGLEDQETELPLGYTFSFPVLQSKINRGTLLTWTKGFSCTGAVGKDPVILLQDALLKKHLPVKVTALVNDTVGTLLSNAYNKPDTIAGLILGTGSNGAYIEQMDKIGKWQGGKTAFPEMIINMEFGAFDNERVVLPLTRYDNKLDRESINPHSQIFEKLISGMYLGEIVRNVLTDMMDRELLFQRSEGFDAKTASKEISVQWGFETSYMSNIEDDSTSNLSRTKEVLDTNLSIQNASETDCRIIKRVCELVGTRAARLAGCAIAAIVQHCGVNEKGADIGIDGSLYEFYPSFEKRTYQAISELMPEYPDITKVVRLGLARDGSGVGAALCACVAARMEDIKSKA